MLKKLIPVIATLAIAFAPSAHAQDVTLLWDPPLTYEDGTALPASEIASYKIYYGQSSGSYTAFITVPGNLLTATITNLAKGNWYFVATTVATNTLESVYSVEVSKNVLSNSKPKPPRNPR